MNFKTWKILAVVGLLFSLNLKVGAVPVNFDFSGGDITATGELSMIANGDGSYTATSGHIDISGGAYPGDYNLVFNPNGTSMATSPLGFFPFDNQFFPAHAESLLDVCGLLFNNPTGDFEVNLWGIGDSTYYIMGASPAGFPDWGTDADVTTPDGGLTAAMLGMGLLGLGWMRGIRTA